MTCYAGPVLFLAIGLADILIFLLGIFFAIGVFFDPFNAARVPSSQAETLLWFTWHPPKLSIVQEASCEVPPLSCVLICREVGCVE